MSLKISKGIGILYRVKNMLPISTLIQIYYSLIYSHLSYCCILWGGASVSTLTRLITLQKRAIRIITNSPYLAHTEPLFAKYSLLKLSDIHKWQVLLFMHKFKYAQLPKCCNHLFMLNTNNKYAIRNPQYYFIPFCRTVLYEKSITITGPKAWNLLNADLQNTQSFNIFKREAKLKLSSC